MNLFIRRTGAYPRNDETLKINLITKTGTYTRFEEEYNTLYSYNWNINGQGNLTRIVYNWNDEIVEEDYFEW